jgi:hypothetical protein
MSFTKSSAIFEDAVEDAVEDTVEDTVEDAVEDAAKGVIFDPDIYIFCIYFSAGASKISE